MGKKGEREKGGRESKDGRIRIVRKAGGNGWMGDGGNAKKKMKSPKKL
jgi:hypothetical protein